MLTSVRLFKIYQNAVINKPYTVQSIQTAGLMLTGDVISQTFIERKSFWEMDYLRAVKFGSIGFILGPILTKWYATIDNYIGSSSKRGVIKKVCLDQILFAPCAIAGLTIAVSLADGKAIKEIGSKLEKDYFCILISNYKLWPIVQFFNFTYIPLNYRVLVVQTVAVAWNTYLSWKLNNDGENYAITSP